VHGRVDRDGRLVSADQMLVALQEDAGAALGERLVLPQLAAIARLARRLGIAVARPALVAGQDHDVEMWVRGEPDGDDVLLTIESWRRKPPLGPRLELAARSDDVIPAPRGEWAADAELRITELSNDLATLLGAGASEAIGQPLTKWLRLAESEDGAMPMLVAVAARTAFAGQNVLARHGANARLILSGNPGYGPDGSFTGFRGTAMPEEKSQPEAANEASTLGIDPALDQALRSPIDRIIRAAEGIADRSEGPLRSDYAVYAGDIAAAARHLLSVIRTMVDQPPEEAVRVDVVALADEAIGLVEPMADEKKVTIHREGVETLGALGDDRSIVQILVNLLGNAVRHSPNGTTIAVRLTSGTEFASLTVSDEGKGIATADQERIFGRFERGEEGGGSSGLGLAIARRLARSMGGDITLVSTPGNGASFTLSLPLA
jgi:signal transduction histidine kinase